MSKNRIHPIQEWDAVTLTKSKQPVVTTSQHIISPEEQIERQKIICSHLRSDVQKARLGKKWTQIELAAKSNLSLVIVKEIENGSRIQNEREILTLEKALGVKMRRR